MKIKNYELENDIDCKRIPDGWEIFPDAVEREGIRPDDFESAYWNGFGSIIVENA